MNASEKQLLICLVYNLLGATQANAPHKCLFPTIIIQSCCARNINKIMQLDHKNLNSVVWLNKKNQRIRVASHTLKLLERIIDQILIRTIVELGNIQFGFRRSRSTMNPVFALNILQKKQKDLHMIP